MGNLTCIKCLFSFLVLLPAFTSLGAGDGGLHTEDIESNQNGRDLSLFMREVTFSVTTSFMKTTGFLGHMFGHYSRADEEAVLRKIQTIVSNDFSDLSLDSGSVRLLPPVIEQSDLTVVDSLSSQQTSLFGVKTIHGYEKYRVDYVLRFNVLLPRSIRYLKGYEYLGQVTPTLKIEYRESGSNWQHLARLDSLDPNMISLGAVDLSRPGEKVGKISLADIHKEYRYELGRYLRETFPQSTNALLSENSQLRIYLDFQDNNGSNLATSTIELTDNLDGKKEILKAVGVSD